jgi:hypothetical protein
MNGDTNGDVDSDDDDEDDDLEEEEPCTSKDVVECDSITDDMKRELKQQPTKELVIDVKAGDFEINLENSVKLEESIDLTFSL